MNVFNSVTKKYRKYFDMGVIIKLWQLFCLAQRGYRIKQYIKSYNVRKLQLGSGENVAEGWLNTDLLPLDTRIIFLDITVRFPFEDNVFDYIFSEHLIEHISYDKGYLMLQECYRVLKPGGIIRIATPDLLFLIELFRKDKMQKQKDYIQWMIDTYNSPNNIYSETFVINNLFHNWGHQFIYDFDVLKKTLENIGFISVIKSTVGDSDHDILRELERHGTIVPDEFNRLETMVIEAKKT